MTSPASDGAARDSDADAVDSQIAALLAEYARVLDAGDSRERAACEQRLANLPPEADAARAAIRLLNDTAAAMRSDAARSPAHCGQAAGNDVGPPALGDFRLLRPIGRGGMGAVYEAEQLSLGRRVAVKVLPHVAALDATRLARFRQEAQAAARLRHPQIVPVFAVGCEQDLHYYAMQLVNGRSLADMLQELRALPRLPPDGVPDCMRAADWFAKVAAFGAQAADALQHAHDSGVIHRDVKPANLLVDLDGRLYVTDFGLASIADAPGLTGSGDLLGTLRYASPEQVLGQHGLVDQRSDVYSLGATLYELLTLSAPRPGETRPELLGGLVEGVVPPLRRRNPAVPRDLETVVLKALETDREDRFLSVAALGQDLRRFLAGAPIAARRAGLWERAARRLRRRPRAAAAMISLLALCVLLLAGVMMLMNVARREALRHEAVARRMQSQLRDQRDAALQREQGLRRFRYVVNMNGARSLIERGSWRDAETPLNAHLPRPGDTDERDFAWHYLNGLREQDAVRMPGHDADVYYVDFSPDARRLASASRDGTVRLWDAGAGAPLAVLRGHTSEVNCVQFSPDGTWLVSTGDDSQVRLWNADTAEPVATLAAHQASVVGASVHPDGQSMATVDAAGWLFIWDVASQQVLHRVPAHPERRIEAVEHSPDGSLIATCDWHGVSIWDARGATEPALLQRFEGNFSYVECLAWSSDNRRLASVSGNTVLVWDVAAGRVAAEWSSPNLRPRSVCFTPDGQHVAVGSGSNHMLWLWSPAGDSRVVNLRGHAGGVWCVRCSPDGRWIATSSADASVRLWDADAIRNWSGVAVPATVRELAFSSGAGLLARDDLGRLTLWDCEQGRQLFEFPGDYDPGGFAPVPGRQRVVTADSQARIAVWNLAHSPPVIVPSRVSAPARAIAVSPDGRLLARAGENAPVEVWDIDHGTLVRRSRQMAPAGVRMQFSGDGRRLFILQPDRMCAWSLDDDQLRQLPVSAPATASCVISDAPFVYIGSSNGQIIEHDLGSMSVQRTFWHDVAQVDCLALSPDQRILASGGGGFVRLTDLVTGSELFASPVTADLESVRAIAFSPDGRRLVISASRDQGPGHLLFWNTPPASDGPTVP